MLRESISPEVIAREYGLNAADVLEWKTAFLSQLKTATKGAAAPKPLARRKETRPVVEDISRKRIRAEDAKRPPTTNPMAPFPGQSTAPPLTPADRANLEKTQRLILEKGQVAEAGKKFGMMPR